MIDIAEILDNTARKGNYKELGIFKFAKFFFPDRFKDDFAELHYDMCSLLFRLLDPIHTEATDRNSYFLVHREAAKTTVGTFLFPIFLLYLKGYSIFVSGEMLGRRNVDDIIEIPIDERFIMIASATAGMAETFVTNLRSTLESRADLARMFGEKNPRMMEIDESNIRTIDKMWRKQMFITADGTVVRGIGMGQQVRGSNVGGSRPTLIICDDIYSEDNVKTEYSRTEVRKWFFNAVLNSLDSHSGKMLLLGTMVHPDSIFKQIQGNPMWFGMERPIVSEPELRSTIEALREMGKMDDDHWYVTAECIMWFKQRQAECTTLSWPERHTLRKIIIRYREKMKSGDLNWFYQEHMNMPIAPEVLLVQEHSFYRTDPEFYIRNNQQYVKFKFEQAIWFGPVNLYIGIDPASSVSTTSDDTVIVVAGLAYCTPMIEGYSLEITQEQMVKKVFPIIAHIEGGKYAISDYEGIPGMIQAVQKICNKYVIDKIKIEAMATQEQIAREIRTAMKKHMVISYWSNTNKTERVLSIILSIVQKYQYIICKKNDPLIDKLFYQLLTVGIADHDDYPDALSIALEGATEPYGATFAMEVDEDYTQSRYELLYELYGDRAWEYL